MNVRTNDEKEVAQAESTQREKTHCDGRREIRNSIRMEEVRFCVVFFYGCFIGVKVVVPGEKGDEEFREL